MHIDLKVLKENDPILKETSEAWDFEKDGDPTDLVKAMTRLMFEYGGIGLAAPQCGILKRIFIMGNEHRLIACINPEVVEAIAEEEMEMEGCLSFPDLWLRVKRPKTVKVKYYDITGKVNEDEFDNITARVFQHELDHLNGICFDSKVAKLSLQLAKERRKKKLKKVV